MSRTTTLRVCIGALGLALAIRGLEAGDHVTTFLAVIIIAAVIVADPNDPED